MNSGVHVPYMSEMQRETYKVTVNNGVVWWQYTPLDMGNQSFLYVMDAGGNIFSGPQSEVEHHSSFLSGQPVAAAGMWQVAKGSALFINQRRPTLPSRPATSALSSSRNWASVVCR